MVTMEQGAGDSVGASVFSTSKNGINFHTVREETSTMNGIDVS